MKDELLKHFNFAARRNSDNVDWRIHVHKPALLRHVCKSWRNNNRIERRVLFTVRKRSYIVNLHWCRYRGSCLALVVCLSGGEISMSCLCYGKYSITHIHARTHARTHACMHACTHACAHTILITLQACSNFTFEDVSVLGECCPPGCDSSLNRFVLGFVSGAVSLSRVDVAFNVFDLSVVDIYWCVVFHHHLCL